MTFYGESLFALGILIILAAAAAAAFFILISVLTTKRIKSRLAKEYGEKPNR